MEKATKWHSLYAEILRRFRSRGHIQEATVGFEPTHKGFAGPRRVLSGPYVVIASNPVKGFHSACSGKYQDPLPSLFLPGNKLTNRIVDWYT